MINHKISFATADMVIDSGMHPEWVLKPLNGNLLRNRYSQPQIVTAQIIYKLGR